MTVTLTASTGAKILVWRDCDTFGASLAGTAKEAQICMGIDLFEVIAELAGLDLDSEPDADEATRLACEARQRLSSPPVEGRRWR